MDMMPTMEPGRKPDSPLLVGRCAPTVSNVSYKFELIESCIVFSTNVVLLICFAGPRTVLALKQSVNIERAPCCVFSAMNLHFIAGLTNDPVAIYGRDAEMI